MDNHQESGEIPQKNKQKKKKNRAWVWVLKILILTFVLSMSFGFAAEVLISASSTIVAMIIVVVIIFISIIADIVGTAAASANVEPFLAMAARKVKGAKRAVWLVKNNEKVSSICNDVIGDICGIISGAAGAAIAVGLFVNGSNGDIMSLIGGIIVSAVIATLTVGGKALGKKIAISNNSKIIFFVARMLSVFGKK